MSTVTLSLKLTLVHCANCAAPFAVTEDYQSRRRKDHKPFYCPSGHQNVYSGETEEEKRIRQLESRALSAERSAASWRTTAENAERKRRAAKGQLTKIKKRVAAGVCPCCSRTFQNLARHMKGQHPDFAGSEP